MNRLSSIARRDGFTLSTDTSIFEAMESMLKNATGTVVLLHEKKPVGIVTESLLIEQIAKGMSLNLTIETLAKKELITINKEDSVAAAFDLLVTNNIRRLIMVDKNRDFYGVILQEDLFDLLEEDVYKIDLKVKDLLSTFSVNIIAISDQSSIQDASLLMYQKNISSVIINNAHEEAIGIVTEKDILTVGYKSIDIHQNIKLLMSSPVLSVDEEDTVFSMIEMMKGHNIRRILVKNRKNQTVGLLSNKDIFHYIKGNVSRILEIKLRHAKEIMNILPQAIIEIFDHDAKQTIHWMNHQAKQLFTDKFLNRSPEELMGEFAWKKLYESLHKKGIVQKVVILIHQKSFEFSGTISKDSNNNYIKLIAQDITKHETIKQQLQEEIAQESKLRQENEYLMMQQSRMASMGEMVGHIAHQWRQPLAQLGGIFMNLQSSYLFGELDKNYLEEKIEQGNSLITYMSETIDDFHLFFSPQQTQKTFDLVLYLKQAVSIVKASLNYHHIEVVIEGEENEFFSLGLPNEFAQSILNLLNNARDSLSKTNEVKKEIRILFKKEETQIMILFCDNGEGISKHILPHIFEPFVTGKSENEGWGAGLYITRLIIEQKMGGTIEAYNLEKGACFKILL